MLVHWRAGAGTLEGRCWYIGGQVLVHWRAGARLEGRLDGRLGGRCWVQVTVITPLHFPFICRSPLRTEEDQRILVPLLRR